MLTITGLILMLRLLTILRLSRVLAAENERESKGYRVLVTIKNIRYFSSIKVLLVANN